ncbi:MAG: hypothetical protein RLZZ316_59 [Bacteroidota bacterium]|jgi:hypothetical protein
MELSVKEITALQLFCKETLQAEVAANSYNILLAGLAAHINQLIQHRFDKLIQLLYQIDVDEKKLKTILQNNAATDAGMLIAAIIIKRQLQKIQSIHQFSANKNNIADDEKW